MTWFWSIFFKSASSYIILHVQILENLPDRHTVIWESCDLARVSLREASSPPLNRPIFRSSQLQGHTSEWVPVSEAVGWCDHLCSSDSTSRQIKELKVITEDTGSFFRLLSRVREESLVSSFLFLFALYKLTLQREHRRLKCSLIKMGDETYKGKVPLVEDTKVKVLYETQASAGPDDKAEYPPAGTNSIYSAILSRNEAVKDAKRLKTFLELRDKYVKKKVVFEDPLFPANDSSLFYSHKSAMKIEWKRPSVSASRVPRKSEPFSKVPVFLITSSTTHGVGWPQGCGCIAPGCHLLQSQTADSHTGGLPTQMVLT